MNYLAILLAALAAVVVGSLWYSPLLFGKVWLRLRHVDPSAMQGMSFPKRQMAVAFVAALVCAYVLALFVSALGISTVGSALRLGFFVWLGFYATTLVDPVLWEDRPWMLYTLNAGHRLISTLVMALVIGVFL